MSTLFRAAPERAQIARLDIGLLNVADRACLRLLYRCEIATGMQLTTLIYPSRRTALRHLRRLWQLGLVERTPLRPIAAGYPSPTASPAAAYSAWGMPTDARAGSPMPGTRSTRSRSSAFSSDPTPTRSRRG